MRSLLVVVILIATGSVTHAQVTCQMYGSMTNCNGSLGPAISSNPVVDWAGMMAGANLQNQQAALAQQQAQLVRAQAEAIRQQTIAANQQRFLANVATASDDELRTGAASWNNSACQNSESCRNDAAFTLPAINAEIQRRSSNLFDACLKRFPPPNSSGDAAATSDRCKQDPWAVPTIRQGASSGTGTAETERPKPAPVISKPYPHPKSQFRQEIDTLDNALDNGLITRAEYDNKLSALLQNHRAQADQ